MKQIQVSLSELYNRRLPLGRVGENVHVQIVFLCNAIFSEYPNAITTLIVTAPGGESYAPEIQKSGTNILWTITDSDLAKEGGGEVQLTFKSGSEVSKSYIGKTQIFRSLAENGEVPTPVGIWIDRANETVRQAAQDAADATVELLEDKTTDAIADINQAAADARASIPGDYSELSDDVSGLKSASKSIDDWIDSNDFAGNDLKTNVLQVPYEQSDVLDAATILSSGAIRTGTAQDENNSVTPLIEVKSGVYGLKTQHSNYDVGQINSGNTYKNGFSFFASDGETVVARPSNMQALGSDIYIFEVPAGAKYVRFCYITGGASYRQTALEYFNQWILLSNADNTIDDSFFVTTPAQDGEIHEIERKDGSKLAIQDQRIGDLADLETTAKGSIVAAINEANNSSSGDGDAEAWMAVNDFDSTVGGKTNVLFVPYDYETSGFLNNAIIMSNGTTRQNGTTDTAYVLSPLVAVTAGMYGLKTIHSTQGLGNVPDLNGGFGLFANDGTTPVSKPSARTDLENDIFLFEIPETASFIRFVIGKGSRGDNNLTRALEYFNQWILLPDADNTIDDSFFVLAEKKDNGEIDKIRRRDGSYLEIVDAEARSKAEKIDSLPTTFGRRTCAIFEKVCCIGDSFTAGYIYSSAGVAHSDPKYSWVKHLESLTGREYVNLGISGATSASWLTNENGLAKMLLPENKSQAYLIGLQINDAATEFTVGTVEDIGTDTVSYYGCISKIINQIFTVNSLAHVFIQTQPKNFTGAHTPYRTALLNIVEWYQTEGNGTHQGQVHLIDLLDYYKLYQSAGCNDSMANGHFTAVGWEYCAEILMYAWSNYINTHPLLFQDVNLIPFGVAT